jgi:hypothetical protein
LTISAKETADLTDREYLMRKATLGSRSERFEALDVIERANDIQLFDFLMERLKKEDDRCLQIKIMHVLAAYGDVRAVSILRYYARWDTTRVGIEAVAALYEMGDDSFIPSLILKMRPNEESPETPGLAHRALKKMTGTDLPQSVRVWMNYYRIHRLAPYETNTWYWPFRPPLPPVQEGSTQVATRPSKGKAHLPEKDVKIRRTQVMWADFWKPE